MNFILTPFGSGGDVYPFIWIGKLLANRGHSVSLIAAVPFREAVEQAGLRFVGMGTEEEYLRVTSHPDIWDAIKGPEIIFDYAGQGIRLYFDAIRNLKPVPDTVLIASTLAFGSRVAREKLGLRMISVHLQPSTFLSAIDMPILVPKMEWLSSLPYFLRKWFYRIPNPLDKILMPYLKKICEEEGLPKPGRIFDHWWHSPDGVIGLFPEWFAAPQADWPREARLFGFPLYDLRDQSELPPELMDFLAKGEKPILFTPGTAMQNGQHFFATALEACRRAGLRTLLVTRHSGHLPPELPETAMHCSYLPFSQVLPFCAALVSHGGVGTISQGLAAGIPQLVMPMAHDQPDNLNRLRRLRVGDGLYPDKFTPEKVAEMLKRLIGDPFTQNACGFCARKLQQENEAEELVEYLEGGEKGNRKGR